MKIYIFTIIFLTFCFVASCSFHKKRKQKTNSDEFELYAFMDEPYASNNMKFFCDDSLLYDGDFRISENISIMYISNVRKGEMSHIRLQAMNIDTTFSISTINVDSILIGIPESGIPIIFDNHTKGVWLVD